MKYLRLACLCVSFLTLLGCDAGQQSYQRHAGSTMGTQYRVTADCPVDVGSEVVRALEHVNAIMSTYDPESTLSRFNRSAPGGWVEVDAGLVDVVAVAARLSAAADGAFDVTVGPLVNLWGFGPDGGATVPPSAARIDAALARVGHALLEHRSQPPALRKQADVYVDLSAIAKGYGVDRLADRLLELGCANFLVEIGGELRAYGRNERGVPWRVGVEVPDPASFGGVQRVLQPGDGAVATSGDYRNFREVNGARYSHTIDPRTGWPVTHGLASVTVAHASAMWADGYATLLAVLGPDDGYTFALEHELGALFIEHTENGFEERYTPVLQPLLGNH